jgi:hypothetical protein
MGKKNKNKNKKSQKTERPQPETRAQDAATGASGSDGGSMARLVAIGLLVLGGGFFAYAILGGQSSSSSSSGSVIEDSSSAPSAASQTQRPQRRFRYYDSPEAAKPLPVTLPPTDFRNPGIANTYAIAKEIPEILAQQPCLCGCDQSDNHASLLDCFADEHAATCAVCMKEAILAKQMTEAGKAAAEIREAILRHDFSNVSIGN